MLLTDADDAVRPCHLVDRCDQALWRYDFRLPLGDAEHEAVYAIGERRWRICVPAVGNGALRLAYTACNGMEGERTWGESPSRNERWRHLAAEHARAPFHLLLHGGDQLYADTVWEEVPALAAWQRLPARRRLEAPFTPDMAEAVGAYFLARYRWLWGQPDVAPLLATIPSLMMWDDHDIFDGWGSHDPEWQACPVFRGIYAAAREHFALFQLCARPDRLPTGEGFIDPGGGQFGWAHRVLDGVGVVAPDLRSERSKGRVMSEPTWAAFAAALEGMADCRHVLLMSSVPAINAAVPLLDRIYEALPGHQYFQLDLRDQWRSIFHHDEWLRLLRHLLAFAARTGARVTVLSGEIHLGAFAVAEDDGNGHRVYQLTSSGIVLLPPWTPVVAFMDWMSTGPAEEVAPGMMIKQLPIPGLGKRFLGARNWLALEVSAAGDRLAASWHSDASSFSVILPPEAGG